MDVGLGGVEYWGTLRAHPPRASPKSPRASLGPPRASPRFLNTYPISGKRWGAWVKRGGVWGNRVCVCGGGSCQDPPPTRHASECPPPRFPRAPAYPLVLPKCSPMLLALCNTDIYIMRHQHTEFGGRCVCCGVTCPMELFSSVWNVFDIWPQYIGSTYNLLHVCYS